MPAYVSIKFCYNEMLVAYPVTMQLPNVNAKACTSDLHERGKVLSVTESRDGVVIRASAS